MNHRVSAHLPQSLLTWGLAKCLGHRILTAVLAWAAIRAHAEERMYPIYPVRGQIAVDGRLDEEAWRGAARGGDFLPFGALEPIAQTSFRVLYDADNVYFGIRANEDHPARLRIGAKDGGHIWLDDSIEIFVLPEQSKPYFQFAVNSIGSRFGTGSDGKQPSPDDWEALASHEADGYVVELRMPFALLGVSPETARHLYVNIGRNHTAGGSLRHSTWAPLSRSFHEPKRFARFCLRPAPVSPQKLAQIDSFVNLVLSCAIETLARRTGDEYERLIKLAGPVGKLSENAQALVRKWQQRTEAISRYCDYVTYFRAARTEDGFWERDHNILTRGPCAPVQSFIYGVQRAESDEGATYSLLLEALLR